MNLPRYQLSDMPEDLAGLLRPRVERLGYLGEFFQYMANQPEALAGFIVFSESAKDGLAKDLTEVVALTAATLLENRYELHQHERLCVKLGLGEAWVADVESLDSDGASLMDNRQRAVQRFVLGALASHGTGMRAHVDGLIALIGPSETVAVLMLLGRYAAHGLIVNSLGLEPPVPSIFPAAAPTA